jgi:glyoxylase-like metal-dependent hydrolase (beta-lactamase superfamily II)
MATPLPPPLVFDKTFDPQSGRAIEVVPGIVRVTAPNGSAYTFTGTNSFLLGSERLIVVDPGPDSEPHLAALKAAIAGRPVEAIVLTHTHRDHSALAPRLKSEIGAPLWFGGRHGPSRPKRWWWERDPVARDSHYGLEPDRMLADGDVLTIGDMTIEVIPSPGHCSNHLCLGIRGTPHLLTGDHVMGWNSTLVAAPDGSMADYFQSLERTISSPYTIYHPAHGGPIQNGPDYARALLAHRELRNEQIRLAMKAGVRSLGEMRRRLYPMLDWPMTRAAGMVLQAHAEYLEARGELKIKQGFFGLEVEPVRGAPTQGR